MAGYYDQATLQALQDYIAANNQAPTAPSVDPDIYKQQNTWATGASKFGNLSTDLDWLLSSGQLQPGAFDPVSSYEPVDAPGYRLMQSYAQGTPLQQYVTKMWNEGGKSAMEIYQDLQSMVADPKGDPFALEVIRSLPKASVPITDPITKQTTGYQQLDQPDMMAAKDFLDQFERTVLSDPEYTIDPTTGAPATVKTEDSAARKAALEAGYVNVPGETFDPYSLAPEGTRESDEIALAAPGLAQSGYDTSLAALKGARGDVRDSEGAYRRWLDQQDEQNAAARGTDTRDWKNEAPVVKAWWEAQDAAGSATDALGRGGEIGADWLGTGLGGIEGLFRKKDGEEVRGRPDLVDYEANDKRIAGRRAAGDYDNLTPGPIYDWAGGRPDLPAVPSGGKPAAGRTMAGLGQFPNTQNVNLGGLPQINLQDIYQQAVRGNFDKQAKAKRGKGRAAVTDLNKARQGKREAMVAADVAARGQAIRQALVNQMPTMFDLERNARNQFNYGRGQ